MHTIELQVTDQELADLQECYLYFKQNHNLKGSFEEFLETYFKHSLLDLIEFMEGNNLLSELEEDDDSLFTDVFNQFPSTLEDNTIMDKELREYIEDLSFKHFFW